MSNLTKVLKNLHFDEDDVKALDELLGKFAAYKIPGQGIGSETVAGRIIERYAVEGRGTGLPDYSPGFTAYTPILGFALLKSLAKMAKQTGWLIVLSCVLGVLAIAQVALIVLQVID